MLLIGNATVLTFDEETPIINNGAVLIEGIKIKEIGETEVLLQNIQTPFSKTLRNKV